MSQGGTVDFSADCVPSSATTSEDRRCCLEQEDLTGHTTPTRQPEQQTSSRGCNPSLEFPKSVAQKLTISQDCWRRLAWQQCRRLEVEGATWWAATRLTVVFRSSAISSTLCDEGVLRWSVLAHPTCAWQQCRCFEVEDATDDLQVERSCTVTPPRVLRLERRCNAYNAASVPRRLRLSLLCHLCRA